MPPISYSKRGLLIAALCIVSSAALAQQPVSTTVRGKIASLDGIKLNITDRSGASVSVQVPDKTSFTGLSPIKIGEITPNSYVGVAAIPQADGTLKALSVHIFPEAMRGRGEGSRPSDVAASGSMTNGAVSETIASNDGRTLMVRYKDGEKKVVVDSSTSLVALQPGAARSELVPGVSVVVRATKADDGTLTAENILIGRNGVVPAL
jgi:hypothetical protein